MAEAYAYAISRTSKTIRPIKKPKFNLDAYNDLRYLDSLMKLNEEFEKINDINLTEKFLKGE